VAVASTDIKFKYSVKTGSAGNSTAGTAAGSLGKYLSTTEIPDATLHALFDVVTGAENAASDVEYRCIFVHNENDTDSYSNVVVWISSEVAGGASVAIAIDGVAASAEGDTSAQADEVADESTAPSGESFSSPTTKGTGLSLGTLAANECRAIWVRRTAADSAAVTNDGAVIRIEGDV
jgi:hypothetical protein